MTSRQIFLSHHSAEKPIIRRLKARLERPDLRVWLDEREIEPLEPLSEKVLDGLRSSRFFLAWWFGEFGASVACQFELITALASAQPQAAVGQILVVGPEAILSDAALGRLKAVKLPILPADPSDAELDALADQLRAHIAGHPDAQTFGAMGLRVARSDEAADPRFVGRARELLELHAQLWADAPGVEGQGAAQALVSGLGGQGKTQLAQEYARRFAVCYPGGLLRLDLPGDTIAEAAIDGAIDSALLRAAQRRNLPTGTGARDEVRGALLQYFSGRGAYLWLVDNVPSRANEAQIAVLRAPSGEGTTLFTARARLPGIAAYPLDRLRPADALRLLKRIAEEKKGEIYPPARLEPLIQHVHGHALSLALLGHALAGRRTPESLLAQIKGTPVAGLERLIANYDAKLEKLQPVLATLLTMLNYLPTEGPPATSRALLGLLTQLAEAPVPAALLLQALGEEALDTAESPLDRLGLIGRDTRAAFPGGEAVPVLSLHPLLAEVVTLQPGFANAAPVAGWLEKIDAGLLADIQAIVGDTGHYRRDPLSCWLLPHARQRAAAALARGDTGLGFWTGWALGDLGDFPGARMLQTQVLEAQGSTLGPEHPDTLNSMSNLASTLWAQGDLPGARALQEQVLEAQRRTLGPEHPTTLTGKNNLAAILVAQGDLSDARRLQQEVLEAQDRTLGQDHPSTLLSGNNLANTLLAQGDLTGARELQEQVLARYRRSLGPEHPSTLLCACNLAETLRSQGDLSGARELATLVLEDQGRVLGPEHPDTLTSLNNLALTHKAQGDLPQARALIEQVLEALGRTLGSEHPETLTSMNNLATILCDQGDLPGARALQEKVLEAHRRLLGPEHPNTLASMNNLAGTLYAQGDLPGARALQEQVLEANHRLLGPEHPATLISMNSLSSTLHADGDLAGAWTLQDKALKAQRLILGPEHPDTLKSLSNLAYTLFALGNLDGARALHEQALEARRRTLGLAHNDTLVGMGNLAIMLKAQGDPLGARILQEKVVAAQRRSLGPMHPDTLRNAGILASFLSDQGDLSGARALHEQVVAAQRRTLGPEHPDTLISLNNFSFTLYAQGDFLGAQALVEQVLGAQRRTLGPEHPHTLKSLNNLAETLRAIGDLPAARALIAPTLHLIPTIQQADVRTALLNTARLLNLPLPGDPL
jgi:tetratricopeptide (TPR) repeat protein